MKLHTGGGGITGHTMAVDGGEAWWMDQLCPEAREGLRRLMEKRAADPDAYEREFPGHGGRPMAVRS